MENPYSAPDAALDEPPAGDDTYQPELFAWRGRIGRLRYLAYSTGTMLLYAFVMGVAAAILIPLAGGGSKGPAFIVFIVLAYIPIIITSVVMTRRRLNDLNHSGWLQLLLFIPFVNLFFWLYLVFAPGTPTANQYGPRPVKNSWGVVAAGLILPVFFFIVMAAAIAIPAYQSVLKHAKPASAQQVRPADD
jgi:uncharacterized membrane protein YhaH (DUF805 family)